MTKQAVLLVEDEPMDVASMAMAFDRAGYKDALRIAHDAEEATAYVEGDSQFADRGLYPLPSLILLDITLPKGSGFEFLRWLRERPESKDVPVVMLTSSADYQDVKKAFELGANSYVPKPKTLDELMQTMKTLLTFWLELHRSP